MAEVEELMVARLKDDSAVKAITTRIQPMAAKQQGSIPYITYQGISRTPINHATGTTTTESTRVQVDCWASSWLSARALGNAVQAALNGKTEVGPPVVSQYHLTSRNDDMETPQSGTDVSQTIYRDSQDYLIWYSTE
jgi:hypothetical protein